MIEVRELHKRFGATTAVDGVSFDIRRGETFGLLGPNGAGKSTTIGMLTGVIRPDSGTTRINGRASPTDAAARMAIGVAPQNLSLYEELSAAENLNFFGRLYRLSGDELQESRRLGPGVCRPRGPAQGTRQNIFGRHEAASEPGRRAGSRSGGDLSRRADGGRRPAIAQSHLRGHRTTCARRAAPWSTRRTTWKRPSGCATAWRSWTTAGFWISTRVPALVERYGGRSVVKAELARPPADTVDAAGGTRRAVAAIRIGPAAGRSWPLVVGRRGVSNAGSCAT